MVENTVQSKRHILLGFWILLQYNTQGLPTVADAEESRDLPQEPQPAHPPPCGGEPASCRETD
jgi:hypothetical protein